MLLNKIQNTVSYLNILVNAKSVGEFDVAKRHHCLFYRQNVSIVGEKRKLCRHTEWTESTEFVEVWVLIESNY